MTLFPYLRLRTPSQSRLSAVPALPKGEPRGGRCPPGTEGKSVQVRWRSRPWLPHRGSQGAGVARPAQGVKECESGGAAALGSPYGRAGERSETERAQAVASLRIGVVIATGYPLSHGFQPCQLSQRESQGAASPPNLVHTPAIELGDPQRCWSTAGVTDSSLPAGTTRPLSHDTFSIFATAYTLSVTAFSRASSPKGRAKGRALPARHRGQVGASSVAQPPFLTAKPGRYNII